MKKQLNRIGLTLMALVLSSAIFYSCKKNTSDYVTPVTKFTNTEMTTATFMGQIQKEDGTPLDGATVSTGSHMMTSDADGFFYFSNISTPLNASLIKVEKAGYFKAFRTVRVIPNQDNQVRIMAMALPGPQSLSASAGGTITISNGGAIDFPANAIIDEATNQPYTGTVSVYAKWIDPSGTDLDFLTPGALRGISDEGGEEGLTTYGMQAVELVGSAGEALQLGNGKMAEVTFPLPSSLVGVAPATVPLWHFDETKGMWVEDGEAIKSGTEYKGSVSHFSFWNCDYGGEIVNFTCQLVDASSNPVAGAYVRLVPTSSTLTPRGVMSNSTGTVSGGIPVNTTFNLEYIPAGCSNSTAAIFIQSFSSTVSNVNLGTITVPNSTTTNTSIVTGNVVDCSNASIANTPVKLKVGSMVFSAVTNASGAFSFSINCLAGATAATITAYDITNAVNGTSNITISPNVNLNAGNVAACGTLNQFVTWSSNDGTTTTNSSINEGINGAYFNQNFQGTTIISAGDSTPAGGSNISFIFAGPQSLGAHSFTSTGVYADHLNSGNQTMTGLPVTVNITNYQAVGGFIEGNFTVILTSPTVPSRTVICNFRVKRQI